jgi:hypothetical protein
MRNELATFIQSWTKEKAAREKIFKYMTANYKKGPPRGQGGREGGPPETTKKLLFP